MPSQAALLGSLTIPGEPAYLHAAREFVARTLGTGYACSDTAILLTSELVAIRCSTATRAARAGRWLSP